MTAEIRKLETRSDSSRQSVIEVLEEALEDARKGELEGVAIAMVRPGGVMNADWSISRAGTLAGAIALLQHRFMRRLEDD